MPIWIGFCIPGQKCKLRTKGIFPLWYERCIPARKCRIHTIGNFARKKYHTLYTKIRRLCHQDVQQKRHIFLMIVAKALATAAHTSHDSASLLDATKKPAQRHIGIESQCDYHTIIGVECRFACCLPSVTNFVPTVKFAACHESPFLCRCHESPFLCQVSSLPNVKFAACQSPFLNFSPNRPYGCKSVV